MVGVLSVAVGQGVSALLFRLQYVGTSAWVILGIGAGILAVLHLLNWLVWRR